MSFVNFLSVSLNTGVLASIDLWNVQKPITWNLQSPITCRTYRTIEPYNYNLSHRTLCPVVQNLRTCRALEPGTSRTLEPRTCRTCRILEIVEPQNLQGQREGRFPETSCKNWTFEFATGTQQLHNNLAAPDE